MTASGSIEGSEEVTLRGATVFTQSVEPGRGTSSTLKPACANQPILVAIAKGAAAEETVRAHQPTFTVVCARALPASSAARRPRVIRVRFIEFLIEFPLWAPCAPPFSRAGPRTARAGGCRR